MTVSYLSYKLFIPWIVFLSYQLEARSGQLSEEMRREGGKDGERKRRKKEGSKSEGPPSSQGLLTLCFQPTLASGCDWQCFLAFISGHHSGVGLTSDFLFKDFQMTLMCVYRLPTVV